MVIPGDPGPRAGVSPLRARRFERIDSAVLRLGVVLPVERLLGGADEPADVGVFDSVGDHHVAQLDLEDGSNE
jgi:hypothetical protein